MQDQIRLPVSLYALPKCYNKLSGKCDTYLWVGAKRNKIIWNRICQTSRFEVSEHVLSIRLKQRQFSAGWKWWSPSDCSCGSQCPTPVNLLPVWISSCPKQIFLQGIKMVGFTTPLQQIVNRVQKRRGMRNARMCCPVGWSHKDMVNIMSLPKIPWGTEFYLTGSKFLFLLALLLFCLGFFFPYKSLRWFLLSGKNEREVFTAKKACGANYFPQVSQERLR